MHLLSNHLILPLFTNFRIEQRPVIHRSLISNSVHGDARSDSFPQIRSVLMPHIIRSPLNFQDSVNGYPRSWESSYSLLHDLQESLPGFPHFLSEHNITILFVIHFCIDLMCLCRCHIDLCSRIFIQEILIINISCYI